MARKAPNNELVIPSKSGKSHVRTRIVSAKSKNRQSCRTLAGEKLTVAGNYRTGYCFHEERDNQIIKMWLKGYTATQIRDILKGQVTRNVVIGVISRARKNGRLEDEGAQRQATASFVQADPRKSLMMSKLIKGPPVLAVVKKIAPVEEPKAMGLVGDFPDDLKTCRFVHGEIHHRKFQLCGHEGYPWCAYHKPKKVQTPIKPGLFKEAIPMWAK